MQKESTLIKKRRVKESLYEVREREREREGEKIPEKI